MSDFGNKTLIILTTSIIWQFSCIHLFITGSGLIYIDPHTLRRTANCTIPTSTNLPQSQDNSVSMMTTASQLARVFGILIRQIADLLMMLQVGRYG